MNLCDPAEDCSPYFDYCIHYEGNQRKHKMINGDEKCKLHNIKKKPGDACNDFDCVFASVSND